MILLLISDPIWNGNFLHLCLIFVLGSTTIRRFQRMRIPSLAMAGGAKELAITICFIGLMAGSLCAGSINGQTLNQQASTRRRLLPQLHRIHHPDPPAALAPKQNFLPPCPLPRPAPKKLHDGPPASPDSKEYYALPGPLASSHNQDAYKSVSCGDQPCPRTWIGRKIIVLNFEN